MTTHTTRDEYWDLVKALLIFLVIWGHCIQFIQAPFHRGATYFWDTPFFKGIYLFHMPLFMFVSGYFAAASIRKRGLTSLRRYACRLLIPCASYGLMHIGLTRSLLPLSSYLYKFTILWFLIVVFENTCIYYLFRQYTSITHRILILILTALVFTVFNHFYPLPTIDQLAYLCPFFMVGAVLNERGFKSSHISKWMSLLILPVIPLAFIVPKQLFVYITPPNLSSQALIYDLIRTGIAAVIGAGFLGLVQCLRPFLQHQLLQKIAQATLALYFLQTQLFSSAKTVLPNGIALSHLATFSLSILLLLMLYTLYSVLRKIPFLPFLLFGEKK